MSCMRSSHWHLSPAVGLALSAGGSRYLGRLYEIGDEDRLPSAAARLARALFHRQDAEEALRPSGKLSIPAAHLSASLSAHLVGLADAKLGEARTYELLREARCCDTGLSLPSLCRETGVSIARFQRLVEQIAAADDAAATDPAVELLPRVGSAMVLRHLWLRASTGGGKATLRTYLLTLEHFYGPVLAPNSMLSPGSSLRDQIQISDLPPGSSLRDQIKISDLPPGSSLRDQIKISDLPPGSPVPPAQWLHLRFTPDELDASAVHAAAAKLLATASCESTFRGDGEDGAVATAYERLVCALALGGSRSPPLVERKVGIQWRQQALPPKADCAELVTREVLNAMLWCTEGQAFDASRLPQSASAALKAFYAPGGLAYSSKSASEAFMALVSELPGVEYLSGQDGLSSQPPLVYEMKPTMGNLLSALQALLGVPVPDVRALQAIWRRMQPARGIELRLDYTGDRLTVLERAGSPRAGVARVAAIRDNQRQSGTLRGVAGVAPSPAPLHMLPVLHMERQDDHGTALEIMLEIVLLEGRNHAFAVHHERQPSWLPTLAAKVYAYWRQNGTPITHHPRPMSHSEPSAQTTPSTVRTLLPQLVPALAQPLLAFSMDELNTALNELRLVTVPPVVGNSHSHGGSSSALGDERDARGELRRQRLLLLCTSAGAPADVAASIVRLLAAQAARPSDALLAARMLLATRNFSSALSDEQLLGLARAFERSELRGADCISELRAAAASEPPFGACVALVYGPLCDWHTALLAAPMRVSLLTLRAAAMLAASRLRIVRADV